MDQEVDVTKYIIKFGVAYIIGLVVLLVIFGIFELDHSSGASIGVLIGAAIYAVGKFIQENRRVPSKSEKSKLVWSSFIISWLASVLLFIIVVLITSGTQGLSNLSQITTQLNISIIVGAAVFMSLIYLAVLYYSYGGLAKR